MLTRRGFLRGVLAAGAAPAIVKASRLMPIYVPRPQLLTLWGDGAHDDTAALQALINGQPVLFNGQPYGASTGGVLVPGGVFQVSAPVVFSGQNTVWDGVGSKIVTTHGGPAMEVAKATTGTIRNFWFEREGAA